MTVGTIPIALKYPEVSTLILVTAVGQLLLIPFYIYLLKHHAGLGKRAFSLRLPTAWRIMLRYTALVFLTTVVDQIVWQRSEVFFLGRLSEPAQTAYYSLAYTITGTVISTVTMAITGTLIPVFSSSADVSGQPHAELPRLYRQSFSLLNWIALPSVIGLTIVGPTAILTFYGEAYAPVIPVMYLVILSSAIAVYARPSSSVLHAINKPSVLLVVSLIMLPLNLFLAWYLVPRQGAIGAGLANLAAQSVGAGLLVFYATRTASLEYEWRSIAKSAIGAVACGIVAWLSIASIDNPILSILVAMVAGAAVYFVSGILLKDDTTHAVERAAEARLTVMRNQLARRSRKVYSLFMDR
jgi:O-antigen/teichoic acid export membrane protein